MLPKTLPGVYRAIVRVNDDPEGLLRIKVVLPTLTGAALSRWAWPCVSSVGSAVVPDLEDPVWIIFENGEIEHPVWLGTWATV